MRSTFFILSSITFAACGGGGSDSKTPDAKIFLDSGVDAASACAVKCELKPPVTMADLCEGDNYKSIIYGSDASPADGNFFFNFGADAGPLANRTAFSIGLIVSESSTLGDVLFIRALKPTAGGFVLNTAVPFEPNALAEVPAAYSFIFGDVMINNGQLDLETITQEYWATTGSITFTQIGETDASLIKGQTAPIVWQELDMAGAPVATGCKVNMGMAGAMSGFNFSLVQDATPAFQPENQTPRYINGMRVLTPTEMKAVEAYIAKRHPHLVQ